MASSAFRIFFSVHVKDRKTISIKFADRKFIFRKNHSPPPPFKWNGRFLTSHFRGKVGFFANCFNFHMESLKNSLFSKVFVYVLMEIKREFLKMYTFESLVVDVINLFTDIESDTSLWLTHLEASVKVHYAIEKISRRTVNMENTNMLIKVPGRSLVYFKFYFNTIKHGTHSCSMEVNLSWRFRSVAIFSQNWTTLGVATDPNPLFITTKNAVWCTRMNVCKTTSVNFVTVWPEKYSGMTWLVETSFAKRPITRGSLDKP